MTRSTCCSAPRTPTSVQLESLRKNRSAALYDLMDSLDAEDYEDTDAEKVKLTF